MEILDFPIESAKPSWIHYGLEVHNAQIWQNSLNAFIELDFQMMKRFI